MFQLVYISSSRVPITSELVTAILEASRRNNERSGISGLLVAGGRRFLQALEGEEAAIWETYARIKADPRHHAFVLLTGRTVERRGFGHWSMAYERAGLPNEAGSLSAIVKELTAPLTDKSLRAQFVSFAELHGRAA